MAAIIRIKRSTGTSAPGSLKTGELAYSAGSGTSANGGDRLYFGKGDDGNGNATSVVVIGGEYLGNLLDHTPGTLTASSGIITDANKKVDQLLSGDIVIDGATNKITGLADPTVSSGAATKNYVDNTVAAGNNLGIAGDTGTDTVDLATDTFTFAGGTGLSSTVTDNQVLFDLDSTTVTAGSYGSSTAIPTFTVDAQGRLTAAGTADVSSTLNIAGETGTGTVDLLDSSLSVVGGTGISTSVSGREITVTTVDSEIVHDNLSGFVANEHIDHSSVTLTAGAGLTGGGDITTNRTFNVVGGDGITVNADEVEVTVDNSTIELSASTGSGAIRVKDGGITNAKLANSSITIGSDVVSLGDTITDLNGITQLDVDNIRLDGNVISSTDGSNTLYLDPAPVDSDGGDLVVRGNLIVQGTTTTINSTEISINDLNMVLADSAANSAAADGAGIIVGGASFTGTKPSITYDAGTDLWDFSKSINVPDSDGLQFGGIDWKEVMQDHLGGWFSYNANNAITISYDDGADTLTWSAALATATQLGVATFDETNFTVTSGDVAISEVDGGTY